VGLKERGEPGMKKRKIGLALGGGAARGFAHIGVLEALEIGGINIDMIAGTSAGAAIGALYAQGKSAKEMKQLVKSWDWIKRAQLIDLALPKTGFISGKNIKKMLKSIIGDVEFSELKIPFTCVATDIMSGEEVIINQGSVLEGVRASISLPVIFTVVKWKGRYLVDGGLVDPVPVSVLKDMGADFIIAVNVTPRMSRAFQKVYIEELKPEKAGAVKEPNIFSILMKVINIDSSHLVGWCLNGADVIIEPRLAGIGLGDFGRAEQCILEGELAGIDSVLEIRRRLATA
jgi:NTE family protein